MTGVAPAARARHSAASRREDLRQNAPAEAAVDLRGAALAPEEAEDVERAGASSALAGSSRVRACGRTRRAGAWEMNAAPACMHAGLFLSP